MHLRMREQMHSEGIDLCRLAPITWFCTLVFAFAANHIAAAGYGFSHVRLQSVFVVTIFTGWLALAGTTQLVHRFGESGRHARAWALAGFILLIATFIFKYGLRCYTTA